MGISVLEYLRRSTVSVAALAVFSALASGLAFLAAHADSSDAAPTPASLGAKIFRDVSLSASGQMSCATCHNPANAHAQTNDVSVQSGGANLDVPGFRAVPSLRYLNFDVPFFFQNDGTPTGGFDRDGRANDLVQQAERPLLAPHEMANGDAATFAAKLNQAVYADEFKQVFGANVFDDPDLRAARAPNTRCRRTNCPRPSSIRSIRSTTISSPAR